MGKHPDILKLGPPQAKINKIKIFEILLLFISKFSYKIWNLRSV
jgi:hypothetical protein